MKTAKHPPRYGFTREEYSILSKLNTPIKIQDFLIKIGYNLELKGETLYSPKYVLKHRTANCIEGALFAAAALRVHGEPPLIFDLASVRDDDHVIAVYKRHGCWGSIAKSKYSGLQFREPIHRTLRELAISYFENYFNYDGEKTLRSYSRSVNLSRFDKINWMTTEEYPFTIADYLAKIPHTPLITEPMIRGLRPVTPLMLEAGELWIRKMGWLKGLKARNG